MADFSVRASRLSPAAFFLITRAAVYYDFITRHDDGTATVDFRSPADALTVAAALAADRDAYPEAAALARAAARAIPSSHALAAPYPPALVPRRTSDG